MNIAPIIDKVPGAVARRVRAGTRTSRMLARLVNPLVPANETTVTIRSGPAAGMRIAIDPRREKFYWTGAYELEVQRALVRVLRPGMRFWDIGAHA
ncbi:MAG: hypothetical protein ACYDA3_11265, partial [Gaiellaceae bacterium]